MSKGYPPFAAALRVAALAVLAAAQAPALPARARDAVSSYRLPPASEPSAQGPVDADAPVVVRARPAPEPAPESSPTLAETAAPPATETPSPQPRPRRTATPPRKPSVVAPAPAAASPAPTTAPTISATPLAPAAAPSVAATAPQTQPAMPFRPALPQLALPLGALGMVLLLAGAVFGLRRRRQARSSQAAFAPAPIAPPIPPRPAPVLAPNPVPTTAFATARLACDFTARTLQLSMLTATLAYRLQLTNHAALATGPLVIRADLSFAHASLGAREQLDPRERKLELRHEHPGLAPGDMAEFAGKLALPLAQIRPVRAGRALLFAPLARFLVRSPQGCETFVFTLGEEGARGGLAPIRLDTGPRGLARLSSRAIETERWLTLDPVRQAG